MNRWKNVQGPTWLVAGGTYLGWLLLTFEHRALPAPVLALAGGVVLALHGSLQHETIHGHPSRWPLMRTVLGWPPLSLWLPYEIYRTTHLAHHETDRLGEAFHDPESHIVQLRHGQELSPWHRKLLVVNQTLVGRLVLGPAITTARFFGAELRTLGCARKRRIWFCHLAGAAAVVAWLELACDLSLGRYLLCFVYPGLSLTLLRSFAEHRPYGNDGERTATVVSRAFGILFLYNNLHIAHHTAPHLPWFELPAFFAKARHHLVGPGRGYVYTGGYLEVARRYALVPISPPIVRSTTLEEPPWELAS